MQKSYRRSSAILPNIVKKNVRDVERKRKRMCEYYCQQRYQYHHSLLTLLHSAELQKQASSLVHPCRCLFSAHMIISGLHLCVDMKKGWGIWLRKKYIPIFFLCEWLQPPTRLLFLWVFKKVKRNISSSIQHITSFRVVGKNNMDRKEHLVLTGSRGSYTLTRVLQRWLTGSVDSLIPRENIVVFLPFSSLLSSIYITRIVMLV